MSKLTEDEIAAIVEPLTTKAMQERLAFLVYKNDPDGFKTYPDISKFTRDQLMEELIFHQSWDDRKNNA